MANAARKEQLFVIISPLLIQVISLRQGVSVSREISLHGEGTCHTPARSADTNYLKMSKEVISNSKIFDSQEYL